MGAQTHGEREDSSKLNCSIAESNGEFLNLDSLSKNELKWFVRK